ncbi:unnamed protein product [Musa acuminata subsp. malaccensis]|uniref:(wild Malaysian banana) hypothetical protein n=1 Tax=Musa acuminata subsp. malaccensis TaxID=214687 RepID=A0A804IP52_MUSAM|nr:PREDICTED: probable LRR receptor-like serine/threonine-protein kinase At4g37250 [Musa acuminata subsp. malaccensis]CAG1842017.1 unnamed protein product [Musa acuminata subsp. malaccensis]
MPTGALNPSLCFHLLSSSIPCRRKQVFPYHLPPSSPLPLPLFFCNLRHELLQSTNMSSKWVITTTHAALLCSILLLLGPALGLNQDGALLLRFKYSVLSDPLAALRDWNYDDATPCSWNGVVCTGFPDGGAPTLAASRVIGLVLPNSQLLGCVPPELGFIEHLRHLDLSGNDLNGTLPASIFNASELRVLSLAANEISGGLPQLDGRTSSLLVLNLSDNALAGAVPTGLALLPNLTVLALTNNYLSDELPSGGFSRLEYLDLSSNLINGSLPLDLGGQRLRYLNLSYNRIAGSIPPEFVSKIPASAVVDLAFNNLTGGIPRSGALASQKPAAFAGNPGLCGKPLKNLCTIPSNLSGPPNTSTEAPLASKSPPAFAAMPKEANEISPASSGQQQGGLRPAVITTIVVGDVAGIGLLCLVLWYVYQVKKRNRVQQQMNGVGAIGMKEEQPPAPPEPKGLGGLPCCLRKKGGEEDTEETSASSVSSETEAEEEWRLQKRGTEGGGGITPPQQKQQAPTFVTVDSGSELELETLLKASAYVLGASGSSIVYKAVLADGTALAVRRIGESGTLHKMKDFEVLVRSIAKFRHPNLVRLRGFYWAADEKLLIHDYVPNGSLANISFTKKHGSSPFHLSWESRLRIARGVARGLAYLHEKKSMHGNIKPSNILLEADMEPKIGDFGLERLTSAGGGYRLSTSARLFGSKRSVQSQRSLPDLSPPPVAGASPCGSSSASALVSAAPYQAPESMKNLKPSSKWDVYSFGVLLLELLAGRALSEVELGQCNAGFVVEERNRVVRMADPALRGEVEEQQEALLSCFKLGFACCAAAPQRRPSMKDAIQVLEKLPPSASC